MSSMTMDAATAQDLSAIIRRAHGLVTPNNGTPPDLAGAGNLLAEFSATVDMLSADDYQGPARLVMDHAARVGKEDDQAPGLALLSVGLEMLAEQLETDQGMDPGFADSLAWVLDGQAGAVETSPPGEPSPSAEPPLIGESPPVKELAPVGVSDTLAGEAQAWGLLRKVITEVGGILDVEGDGEGRLVHVTVPEARLDTLHMALVQSLLEGVPDQAGKGGPSLDQAEIFHNIRGFMEHLAKGDIQSADRVLEAVSGHGQDSGLFSEIGSMARDLHESLKAFSRSLDPEMKEMVEEKLPDSSLRLSHIIQITEKAASTTMDLTEKLQDTNKAQADVLANMSATADDLSVLLESARRLMGPAAGPDCPDTPVLVDGLLALATRQVRQFSDGGLRLQDHVDETSHDLVNIFTAQDYQDLTGQVIQKIILLLADLESKLVNLVKRFGVRLAREGEAKSPSPELYGPSHEKRDDAFHSQDEVDDLLKEFGF